MQGKEDTEIMTYCFFLGIQNTRDSMESSVVVKDSGSWDQRTDAEDGEKDDISEKC